MRYGSVLTGSDAASSRGPAASGVRGRLARAAAALAAGVLLALTIDAGAPVLATIILLLAAATALLIARGIMGMPGRRHASPERVATGESGEQAAAVAHDLRSPLVTVHSYLELLAGGAFGPLPAEARRAAERATRRRARDARRRTGAVAGRADPARACDRDLHRADHALVRRGAGCDGRPRRAAG